jgi:N-methylhydantoinase A/oxoprolinase/acetone carboxylase beta subunit
VVLGYINPDYFAGGSIRLSPARRRALEERAARPWLPLEDAAWAFTRSSTPTWSWRPAWSIERGRDPRDLTLVAFGGSGPVHGCRLAQALGIPRIVLPASAGVTAAIGLLAAEVKFDVARTHVCRLDAVSGASLDAMYDEMSRQAVAVVQESAVAGEVLVTRSADAVGRATRSRCQSRPAGSTRPRSTACARASTT